MFVGVFQQSPDFRGFVVSDRTKPTLETPFVDSHRLHSQRVPGHLLLGECRLGRVVSSYVDYMHDARTYLSLGKDTPDGRVVQLVKKGRVVLLKQVGGL